MELDQWCTSPARKPHAARNRFSCGLQWTREKRMTTTVKHFCLSTTSTLISRRLEHLCNHSHNNDWDWWLKWGSYGLSSCFHFSTLLESEPIPFPMFGLSCSAACQVKLVDDSNIVNTKQPFIFSQLLLKVLKLGLQDFDWLTEFYSLVQEYQPFKILDWVLSFHQSL